tara:strand:+ start:60 stop:1103 length:1044 start_codon:yes stop_codon:yes gene_type:complete
MNNNFSDKSALVNLDAAQEVVGRVKPLAKLTNRREVIGDLGGFAALFDLKKSNYKDPLLVSSTDGVGTKCEIARLSGEFETIGQDLVAMCVDDIVCVGAEPLFFLDYIAVGKLEPNFVESLIKGIVAGCQEAGCSLIGGETAEHPGVMKNDAFDLAGFSVGVVERDQVLDPSSIRVGDLIIGLESPNLRSNGFSLVRKVFFEIAGMSLNEPAWQGSSRTLLEELLSPSVIYTPAVLNALKGNEIHAAAHITGGGLPENISRLLADSLDAVIDMSSWIAPRIFSEIQTLGKIETAEMSKVFNLGIGMVLIVPPSVADGVISDLTKFKRKACIIGEITEGSGSVHLQRG